ncbi:MAG: TetR/AcrR family transcriptional regulator [Bacteroidota bacterium]
MASTLKKSKKQIIFEEAARLFKDKGYKAASMRDLADRVGLEQASSLYSHIRSKEEILQKICLDNASKFSEGIQEIEQSVVGVGAQVRALIRLHIRIAIKDTTSVTVFNDEWRHLSPPYLEEFLALRHDYEDRFRKIIEKGIDQGEFRGMNSAVALYTLLNAFRWIHYWYKPDRELSPEAIEKDIINLLLNGLANKS